MIIITERDLIREVPSRWKKQYSHTPDRDKLKILERLEKIDVELVTAKEISEIIGNKFWTSIRCSECGGYTSPTFRIGEDPNYDSETAHICVDCMDKIVQQYNQFNKLRNRSIMNCTNCNALTHRPLNHIKKDIDLCEKCLSIIKEVTGYE